MLRRRLRRVFPNAIRQILFKIAKAISDRATELHILWPAASDAHLFESGNGQADVLAGPFRINRQIRHVTPPLSAHRQPRRRNKSNQGLTGRRMHDRRFQLKRKPFNANGKPRFQLKQNVRKLELILEKLGTRGRAPDDKSALASRRTWKALSLCQAPAEAPYPTTARGASCRYRKPAVLRRFRLRRGFAVLAGGIGIEAAGGEARSSNSSRLNSNPCAFSSRLLLLDGLSLHLT